MLCTVPSNKGHSTKIVLHVRHIPGDWRKEFIVSEYTKKETDFWGNEKEVIFKDGEKIGETRFRETFTGKRVGDNFDKEGNKVSTTKKEDGFFGSKSVTRRLDGDPIGYTKDAETIFGTKFKQHFKPSGELVGESHYEEGFFGGKKKVHTGDYLRTGDRKESSSSTYGSGGSSSNPPKIGSLSVEPSKKSKESSSGLGIICGIAIVVVLVIGAIASEEKKGGKK